MFLHKISLNPRSRAVRRDLASPYEMHSTLSRAFTDNDEKCPPGTFLWRLELSQNCNVPPHVLIQSRVVPDWNRIGVDDWFAALPDKPLDLNRKLTMDSFSIGQRFRFRLRANPSITKGGKRQGLMHSIDQENWLVRKGCDHGFELPKLTSFSLEESERPDVLLSHAVFLRGVQRSGNQINIFSVQFDGILMITDVDKFISALQKGIGHGKAMGLGLLSLVPVT